MKELLPDDLVEELMEDRRQRAEDEPLGNPRKN